MGKANDSGNSSSRSRRGTVCSWISKRSRNFWTGAILSLFLLTIAIEQIAKYHRLRDSVGQFVYAVPYSLKIMGQEGQYIGRIQDVRWNGFAEQPEDVKGFQPRYFIARETAPGATKSEWWCSYYFITAPTAPAEFQPSPFPPLRPEMPY